MNNWEHAGPVKMGQFAPLKYQYHFRVILKYILIAFTRIASHSQSNEYHLIHFIGQIFEIVPLIPLFSRWQKLI